MGFGGGGAQWDGNRGGRTGPGLTSSGSNLKDGGAAAIYISRFVLLLVFFWKRTSRFLIEFPLSSALLVSHLVKNILILLVRQNVNLIRDLI